MLENLSLTQCVACSCQTSNGWVHASGFQAGTMPEAKGGKKKSREELITANSVRKYS